MIFKWRVYYMLIYLSPSFAWLKIDENGYKKHSHIIRTHIDAQPITVQELKNKIEHKKNDFFYDPTQIIEIDQYTNRLLIPSIHSAAEIDKIWLPYSRLLENLGIMSFDVLSAKISSKFTKRIAILFEDKNQTIETISSNKSQTLLNNVFDELRNTETHFIAGNL
ncbi:hypothetical protein SNEBB_007560 [Seison nebaliae]|nr:hypothetical protein SNEBB_007560 [Seison nebaliae]